MWRRSTERCTVEYTTKEKGSLGDEDRGLRVVLHLSLISRGRSRLGSSLVGIETRRRAKDRGRKVDTAATCVLA